MKFVILLLILVSLIVAQDWTGNYNVLTTLGSSNSNCSVATCCCPVPNTQVRVTQSNPDGVVTLNFQNVVGSCSTSNGFGVSSGFPATYSLRFSSGIGSSYTTGSGANFFNFVLLSSSPKSISMQVGSNFCTTVISPAASLLSFWLDLF